MLRLVVSGAEESLCDQFARRVRRAAISPFRRPSSTEQASRVTGTSSFSPGPSDFDAIAYLGPVSPEMSEVDEHINRGMHVLLANDTILSVEDLDGVINRGIARGVHVVAANPDRWLPSRQLIDNELRGLKIGAAGLIRVHRWEPQGSDRAVDVTRLPAPLVRDLDLILWLARQSPNLVFAIESLRPTEKESAGSIQVHLGFAGGGMALVDFAEGLAGCDGYQSLTAICANGAMYADDHPNRQLTFRGDTAQAERSDEGLLAGVHLIQSFVDGLSTPSELQNGIDSWRRVRGLAGAVRRSLDSRQAVSLEDN